MLEIFKIEKGYDCCYLKILTYIPTNEFPWTYFYYTDRGSPVENRDYAYRFDDEIEIKEAIASLTRKLLC